MIWSLNIQSQLNTMGGFKCGLIYFTGNHFTVPITLTREHTKHLEQRINQVIERNKQAGYTYNVSYIIPKP